MSLLHPYAGTETKAKEPLDQDLMDLKIRENLEDLATQIDGISPGGGGGGDEDSGAIGKIIIGGETNEAVYWKRKFHPLGYILNSDPKNPSAFDPEGKSLRNELIQFIQSNSTGLSVGNDANAYLAQQLVINKNATVSFKIKKGVNFFSIMTTNSVVGCDNIEVTIDGGLPSLSSLEDENGNAAPDTYSSVSAVGLNGNTKWYYSLDGQEHIITLKNNDSASKSIYLEAIEIGFRSSNPTIDESIHINAGKAIVRGSETAFDESSFIFGKTELNGHTGSIVLDSAGSITAIDGESPAMTQIKPEETIGFSGAVGSLPVKNNFYFPDSGICLLSTPYGNHHLFSYSSKIDLLIQAHSFEGVVWQSKPSIDFTPLSGFDGAAGEATGDLNINYWGTAPINITAANNKLDFKVTIGGAVSTHVAAIEEGRYSANLVPLEAAIRKAMQLIKPINGEYHCSYNENSQLWEVYIEGEEIEAFELLFSTGANQATSIHGTLGFASNDLTGALSYIATTEKQHMSCKVLEADKVYMSALDPRIKYSYTPAGVNAAIDERINQLMKKGLPEPRVSSVLGQMIQIFPDSDCCGIEISYMTYILSSMVSFQIDDGQILYLNDAQYTTSNLDQIDGRIQTSFLSFPRGSRKITARIETSGIFDKGINNEWSIFFGARQYFTKPAYEKLTKTQAVISTFDISPISLYATYYGNNAGVIYSPAAQDDSINTITENGSWVGGSFSGGFNLGYRLTSTLNDYVDVNFTIAKDGGAFIFKLFITATQSYKIGLFLSSSAIVEATDRISNNSLRWHVDYMDSDSFCTPGLKAGTYNIRIKNEAAGNITIQAYGVIDGVHPQENANDLTSINNTGQGIAFPVNTIKNSLEKDSAERVPIWLEREGYKIGRNSKLNYRLNSPTWVNEDDSSLIITHSGRYFAANGFDEDINNNIFISGFFMSASLKTGNFNTYDNLAQIFIDGLQTLNSFSLRAQVKGGGSPTASRDSFSQLAQKQFNLSCTHGGGNVFNVSDTRGFKLNQTIILSDGVNKENAVILSIIVGVSFTIKKALTLVVASNVSSVEFQGFHVYKMSPGSAARNMVSCFEYEPLKISPSKAMQRSSTKLEYEKVSVVHEYVAGNDLYYPVHSDGIVGNWTTSTIEKIKGDGAAFDFPQDLKNVTGSGKVKISSERLIPILEEQQRF